MIDLQTAVSSGLFNALNGATPLTNLADVWQNPPEDADLVSKGLVIIGLVALSSPDAKDGGLEKATVPIFTYMRKPDAAALYAVNSAVRAAVEGQSIAATGAEIGRPVFISADPKLMEDGETYSDELLFEMFVQPA